MLKSLELFGFKSFADRTRFDFAAGITGVVGPNGSGKSNVVDAVKWILGDQSPKSLRGQEMTDVIFNGTSARKATGFAEATLTFDNSSGFLSIESTEVQVGRRLWRNGDAEYLINNAPARLRDVRELLMGSGAGSAAYSIIEQGRVDQILQSNASARRQVFEEAAGIALFKARRIESERRLQRVDQNLVRLTDIVDEMDARLNATRSQAAKAAKYRELSNELKDVWLGLAADDYRRHESQLKELDAEFEQATLSLEALSEEQKALSAQLSSIDVQTSEVDDRLRAQERKASAAREAAARHESTLAHETKRLADLESETARLRQQRSSAAIRLRETAGERHHHASVLASAEREFQDRQAEVADRERQAEELLARAGDVRIELEELRAERDASVEQVSAIADRRRQLEKEMTQARSVRAELESRLSRLKEREEEWAAVRTDRETSVANAAGFLSSAEERIRRFRTQRSQLAGDQETFQRTLAEQREERSALQARKTLLEDLEQREEGVSIGVREILERARTCPYAPWSAIRGSVADLLEVDLEHAGLLEVALGARAHLVVVDEFGPLVDYLAIGACQFSGRVGFLTLQSQEEETAKPGETLTIRDVTRPRTPPFVDMNESPVPQLNEIADIAAAASKPAHASISSENPARWFEAARRFSVSLHGRSGVICRMDSLVRANGEAATNLPGMLLSDTWVVETLPHALALWQETGGGCRFVTLQGELLDSDGTLTVGSVRAEMAPVSRKSELRRIKNDLLRLDFRITEEERRISALASSLSGVDSELAEAALELRTLSDRHAALNAELADADRALERVRADQESVREMIAGSEETELAALEAQDAVEGETAALTTRMMELAEKIAARDQEIRSLEHQTRAASERRTADLLELARYEGRVQNMRESWKRLEQDQVQRTQQLEEAERRLAVVAERQRDATLNWLNTSAEIHELVLIEETLSQKLTVIAGERQQLKAQRATFLRKDGEMRQRAHALEDRRHRAEIRHRDLDMQVSTLSARIEEEYQLSLDELVESGVSAWQAYRAEQERARGASSGESWNEETADEAGEDEEGAPSAASDPNDEAYAAEVTAVVGEIDSDETLDADLDADPERQSGEDREDAEEYAAARVVIEERVNRLRRKIKHMGSVNTESLRDLDDLETRFQHLKSQWQDLVEAKSALEEIIRRINGESRRLFVETFQEVRVNFQRLFRKAFGGGDGDIVLEDQNDVLDCGIDIVARPPGKELKSITLMSGGEKTLTAFALLLAIFQCRPSPYCVLDEVDAALDEANVERLTMLLKEFENSTQFLIITHKKPTMSVCDSLYGVTMEEAGVSKRLSVRFNDISDNGDLTATARERLRREAA